MKNLDVVLMPMRVTLDYVGAVEAGDFYQVLFRRANDDEDDTPYLLVQRQFEFPDGNQAFIESNLEGLVGQFPVKAATLERNRLLLELRQGSASLIEILFTAGDNNFLDVARVLRIMIPSVVVGTSMPVAPIRERCEAINEFLEQVFKQPLRLSDILREQAVTEQRLMALKQNHLLEMLTSTCSVLKDFLFEVLPEKHATVLSGRYCLDDWTPTTAADLAERLGVSRQRVYELQKKAVQRLRTPERRSRIQGMVLNTALSLERCHVSQLSQCYLAQIRLCATCIKGATDHNLTTCK